MVIQEVLPAQVYRNSRDHLVLMWNSQLLYIDIPNEAIVITRVERIRGDDWKLLEEVEPKRPPGRPKKEKQDDLPNE